MTHKIINQRDIYEETKVVVVCSKIMIETPMEN